MCRHACVCVGGMLGLKPRALGVRNKPTTELYLHSGLLKLSPCETEAGLKLLCLLALPSAGTGASGLTHARQEPTT